MYIRTQRGVCVYVVLIILCEALSPLVVDLVVPNRFIHEANIVVKNIQFMAQHLSMEVRGGEAALEPHADDINMHIK